MRIRAVRVGVAWMNFPPAIVYRFERRIDAAGHQRPVARPLRDAVVEAAILRGFDAMPSLDSSGMRPSTEGSAPS
ncbi:hypothetical protein [Burkholderia contaminans]